MDLNTKIRSTSHGPEKQETLCGILGVVHLFIIAEPAILMVALDIKKFPIEFTKHARERMKERGLDEEEIKEFLSHRDPKLVVPYNFNGNGKVYNLIFNKSNVYDILIGVSITGKKVRVTTCFKQDKQKSRKLEKFNLIKKKHYDY
ncbi:DUF4258 domain-containing protein [Candidatus Parvarchaeota archaeon]|jgi:hypothetical protein|nr:DUF4258 domain-containing protein [Candidatus Parvarchaeota archaeon]